MAGRKDYEERKQARIDHYTEMAGKAIQGSDAAYSEVHGIMSAIPPGQPVLIGHHSEKWHRKDLDRMDSKMHKAAELTEKAGYYNHRAKAAELNNAISGDDPEVLDKLADKIKLLEEKQEEWKAQNKHFRKHGTMKGFGGLLDEEAAKADSYISEYYYGHAPAPAWKLQNNSAEIRRLKKRLEKIQRMESQEPENITFAGGQIVENTEINRVQILFDEIPPEDVRSDLKGCGFRWSRYEKAWQRQRTQNALYDAQRIITKHYNIER